MQQVKFSVFSDLHYRDGNWNSAAERLEQVLERAEREKVDFIMHCGDFCHNVITAKPVIDRYNSFPVPAYHTVGNHDFEQTDGRRRQTTDNRGGILHADGHAAYYA